MGCELAGAHLTLGHWCGAGLGRVIFSTACDPALVGEGAFRALSCTFQNGTTGRSPHLMVCGCGVLTMVGAASCVLTSQSMGWSKMSWSNMEGS